MCISTAKKSYDLCKYKHNGRSSARISNLINFEIILLPQLHISSTAKKTRQRDIAASFIRGIPYFQWLLRWIACFGR